MIPTTEHVIEAACNFYGVGPRELTSGEPAQGKGAIPIKSAKRMVSWILSDRLSHTEIAKVFNQTSHTEFSRDVRLASELAESVPEYGRVRHHITEKAKSLSRWPR